MKHLTGLIQETKDTITYLESVETALNHASISDIEDIREELVETGFVKRRTRDKGHKRKNQNNTWLQMAKRLSWLDATICKMMN